MDVEKYVQSQIDIIEEQAKKVGFIDDEIADSMYRAMKASIDSNFNLEKMKKWEKERYKIFNVE